MKILIRVLKKYEVRNWCGVERERVGSGEETVQVSEAVRVADPHYSGNGVKNAKWYPVAS